MTAVAVLGGATLPDLARELVQGVRNSRGIPLRARARGVTRILRKHGYKQARATETVLEQAEVLCRDWAA